jgi:hypothetical protein
MKLTNHVLTVIENANNVVVLWKQIVQVVHKEKCLKIKNVHNVLINTMKLMMDYVLHVMQHVNRVMVLYQQIV